MILSVLLFSPFADPAADIEAFKSRFSTMMFVSLPGMLLFYAWVLAVGIVCNSAVDESYRKPEKLFRFAVPFAMAYLTIAIWAFPKVVISKNDSLAAVVLPLHIVATILLFYSLIFAARSLAMLNNPLSPGFWNSFRYFLALLYFPIGLWFIQPKLNANLRRVQNGR